MQYIVHSKYMGCLNKDFIFNYENVLWNQTYSIRTWNMRSINKRELEIVKAEI